MDFRVVCLALVSLFVCLQLAHGGKTDAAECLQPKVVGRCRAAIPRYYYDHKAGKCTFFLYGGCDANDNNFHSLEECQATCPGY